MRPGGDEVELKVLGRRWSKADDSGLELRGFDMRGGT